MVGALYVSKRGETSPQIGLASPYEKGLWLAGDHHVQTHFSVNGQLPFGDIIEQAQKFGLQWCVMTDHGGITHQKFVTSAAYTELQEARRRFPKLTLLQGLTWNMPSGEHATVIMPPVPDEAARVAEFETLFDGIVREVQQKENTDAVAFEALQYLQQMTPKPLVFLNQPSRRGLNSPRKLRQMYKVAPDVLRGMEGSPGHQAAPLNGHERCGYNAGFRAGSYEKYETMKEVFRTAGGYDWMTAKVGGVWDTLLAQGVPAYITANSNFHRHWEDKTKLETADFGMKGVVTPTNTKLDKSDNEDFFPCEYSKTYLFATANEPNAIMDALRKGNMFTVSGGLIEGLEMFAVSGGKIVPMGGTIELNKRTDEVTIVIRIRLPKKPKKSDIKIPILHHIDLIMGNVEPRVFERNVDLMEVPSTGVVGTYLVAEEAVKGKTPTDDPLQGRRRGNIVDFAFSFKDFERSQYLRLRGTNRADMYKPLKNSSDIAATAENQLNDNLQRTPPIDTPALSPWNDLWFYSNPIWIKVPPKTVDK